MTLADHALQRTASAPSVGAWREFGSARCAPPAPPRSALSLGRQATSRAMRYSFILVLSVMLISAGCAHRQVASDSHAKGSADATTYFGDNTPDWIYQRYLDVSGYLLRSSDITDEQRTLHRRKAYESYFEYWLLHRSPRATLQPVPPFEHRFSQLMRRQVLPYMQGDDPLSIHPLYVGGICTNKGWIPKIPILKGEDLVQWSDYQRWVGDYRSFIGVPEPPKKESQK